MIGLDHLQKTIGTWAEVTFPDQTDRSVLAHLHEELEELCLARCHEATAEEAADCLILLLTLAHRTGFSLEDALVVKHGRNTRRQWGPPNETGVHHHVKDPAKP